MSECTAIVLVPRMSISMCPSCLRCVIWAPEQMCHSCGLNATADHMRLYQQESWPLKHYFSEEFRALLWKRQQTIHHIDWSYCPEECKILPGDLLFEAGCHPMQRELPKTVPVFYRGEPLNMRVYA